jgi:hypothetical protein
MNTGVSRLWRDQNKLSHFLSKSKLKLKFYTPTKANLDKINPKTQKKEFNLT